MAWRRTFRCGDGRLHVIGSLSGLCEHGSFDVADVGKDRVASFLYFLWAGCSPQRRISCLATYTVHGFGVFDKLYPPTKNHSLLGFDWAVVDEGSVTVTPCFRCRRLICRDVWVRRSRRQVRPVIVTSRHVL